MTTRLESIKKNVEKWNLYSGTQAVNFLGDRREEMEYLIKRCEQLEGALNHVKLNLDSVLQCDIIKSFGCTSCVESLEGARKTSEEALALTEQL